MERTKLNCSRYLQILMHELWFRKRRSGPTRLGDYYQAAFEDFLFKNHIPKQIAVIERRKLDIELPEPAKVMLKDMALIAQKRQQPLAVIVEQALQEYLDKPENYLGQNRYKPGKIEKVK